MTTLTIRRKALAKQEEVPQIPLTKYRRGWRRLLAEHFVARLLCRLATIVFQYEQPERRREWLTVTGSHDALPIACQPWTIRKERGA
jgi:hypothetical protein